MTVATASFSAHRRIAVQESALPSSVEAGTRRTILDAALHLFAERGYGGTSVRDIASRADVQPTTMYAYFPSKEHILAELTRLGHEEHLRSLRAALLDCQPNPVEQLGAAVAAHVRANGEYAMLSVVANAELHALSAELAQPALVLRKQAELLVIEVVQRGIKQGVFHAADPLLTVTAIGGMGMRVANWFSPECGKSLDEVAATYAELARRMLGVRAPGPEPS